MKNKTIKEVLKTRLAVRVALVFILLFTTVIFLLNNSTKTTNPLSPFRDWTLHVSEDREHVTFVYSGEEKDLFADVIVEGVQKGSFKFTNGKLKLHLNGSPNKRVVNEVNIRKKRMRSKGSPFYAIQLARETSEYLKKAYNFTSRYGYIVIQRNTFDLKTNQKNTHTSVQFILEDSETDKLNVIGLINDFKLNALQILKSKENDSDTILSKAILITQFLWDIFSKTGPSDKISSGMSTYQKLMSIKKQGGTVQCAGTRNLFISISYITNTGLIIRKVDAFRYNPFIDNIVVNGHSILEIKTKNGCILFDPFVRVYFKSNNKNLLSAEDIQNMIKSKTLDQIHPVHVKTQHKKRKDFDPESNPFDPYNWNYYTHFYHLKYTELRY